MGCQQNGEFTIKGNLTDIIDRTEKLEFNIPLTYPEGFMTQCKIGNKLEGKTLMFG